MRWHYLLALFIAAVLSLYVLTLSFKPSAPTAPNEVYASKDTRMSEKISLSATDQKTHQLDVVSNVSRTLIFIAMVSKGLASSAKEISFDNFTVIHDDPILLKTVSVYKGKQTSEKLSFISSKDGVVVWFVLMPEWSTAPGAKTELIKILTSLAAGDLRELKKKEAELNQLLNDQQKPFSKRITAFEEATRSFISTQSPSAPTRAQSPEQLFLYISPFAPYATTSFVYPEPADKVLSKLESGSKFITVKVFPQSTGSSTIVVSVDARKISSNYPTDFFDLSAFLTTLELASSLKPGEPPKKIPLSIVAAKEPKEANLIVYRFSINDPDTYYVFNSLPFSISVSGVVIPPLELRTVPKPSAGDAIKRTAIPATVFSEQGDLAAAVYSRMNSFSQRLAGLSTEQKNFARQGNMLFIAAFPIWVDKRFNYEESLKEALSRYRKKDVVMQVSPRPLNDDVVVIKISARFENTGDFS